MYCNSCFTFKCIFAKKIHPNHANYLKVHAAKFHGVAKFYKITLKIIPLNDKLSMHNRIKKCITPY